MLLAGVGVSLIPGALAPGVKRRKIEGGGKILSSWFVCLWKTCNRPTNGLWF